MPHTTGTVCVVLAVAAVAEPLDVLAGTGAITFKQ
jgi:hypothetical protein